LKKIKSKINKQFQIKHKIKQIQLDVFVLKVMKKNWQHINLLSQSIPLE